MSSLSLRVLLHPSSVDWESVLSLLEERKRHWKGCDHSDGEGRDPDDTNNDEGTDGLSPLLLALTKSSPPVPPPVVRAFLDLDPSAVTARTELNGGWNALHSVCRFGFASPEVARLLAGSCPVALALCGDFGENPLHVACRYGSLSPEVLRALLDAAGSEWAKSAAVSVDGERCLPLHYARTAQFALALGKVCPGGMRQMNRAGRTPLHEAAGLASGANAGVVSVMLDIDKEESNKSVLLQKTRVPLALLGDGAGQTPIDIVFGSIRSQSHLGFDNSDVQSKEILDDLWDKVFRLTKSVSPPSCIDADGHFLLIHTLVSLQQCSSEMVLLALGRYPHLALEVDAMGRTPLSLAASDALIPENKVNALIKGEHLWTHGPSAASVPDTEGRLPLHVAAASGRAYQEGLEKILQAEPRALGTRDLRDGMFPFQLAAISDGEGEERELVDLESVYLLLRERPDLLALYLV